MGTDHIANREDLAISTHRILHEFIPMYEEASSGMLQIVGFTDVVGARRVMIDVFPTLMDVASGVQHDAIG